MCISHMGLSLPGQLHANALEVFPSGATVIFCSCGESLGAEEPRHCFICSRSFHQRCTSLQDAHRGRCSACHIDRPGWLRFFASDDATVEQLQSRMLCVAPHLLRAPVQDFMTSGLAASYSQMPASVSLPLPAMQEASASAGPLTGPAGPSLPGPHTGPSSGPPAGPPTCNPTGPITGPSAGLLSRAFHGPSHGPCPKGFRLLRKRVSSSPYKAYHRPLCRSSSGAFTDPPMGHVPRGSACSTSASAAHPCSHPLSQGMLGTPAGASHPLQQRPTDRLAAGLSGMGDAPGRPVDIAILPPRLDPRTFVNQAPLDPPMLPPQHVPAASLSSLPEMSFSSINQAPSNPSHACSTACICSRPERFAQPWLSPSGE